jgi:hypothetical protein
VRLLGEVFRAAPLLAATLAAGTLFRLHAAHLERLLARYESGPSR